MTETKQVEEQLKECEKKFLNALQECPLAVTLEVSLRRGSKDVYLTVRDSGIDFDVDNAANAPRIELAIMKERMKLVNGGFSVQSERGSGTTIQARVPLHAKIDSAERAG
jgi:signal transduction histidine kinase